MGSRVDRLVHDFQEGPASVRNAIRLIVVATIVTTVAGGVAVRIFDHKDFHSLGDAMWWALQTVTTVGYGDITPASPAARSLAWMEAITGQFYVAVIVAALVTLITAKHGQSNSGN